MSEKGSTGKPFTRVWASRPGW